jgi:hypothetical protein
VTNGWLGYGGYYRCTCFVEVCHKHQHVHIRWGQPVEAGDLGNSALLLKATLQNAYKQPQTAISAARCYLQASIKELCRLLARTECALLSLHRPLFSSIVCVFLDSMWVLGIAPSYE